MLGPLPWSDTFHDVLQQNFAEMESHGGHQVPDHLLSRNLLDMTLSFETDFETSTATATPGADEMFDVSVDSAEDYGTDALSPGCFPDSWLDEGEFAFNEQLAPPLHRQWLDLTKLHALQKLLALRDTYVRELSDLKRKRTAAIALQLDACAVRPSISSNIGCKLILL